MNAETLEKAKHLQLQINIADQQIKEIAKCCFIKIEGKNVGIRLEDGWTYGSLPEWVAKEILNTINDYRNALIEKKKNLETQLENL